MSSLYDYIKIYEKCIPDELCNTIINTYECADLWKHMGVGRGAVPILDKNIRMVEGIFMSRQDVIDGNVNRQKIDDDLFNILHTVSNDYMIEFPFCSVANDSGYLLLRYKEGYFYKLHVDKGSSGNNDQKDRILSCIAILNDDYDGGELAFFDRQKVLKLKKGSIVVFPSNFVFPHEVMPIINGIRYSIVTWFS